MQIKNNPNHAPLGAPDHSVISFCFNLYSENIPRSTRYSYEQVDYSEIRQSLTKNGWAARFINNYQTQSTESCWSAFKEMMHEIRGKYVGKRQTGDPHWKSKGDISQWVKTKYHHVY